MFVLMDGQRLALNHAGADAIGAFTGLAPVRPQPQTCVFKHFTLGRCGHTVKNHAPRIGQQHRMTGPRKLLMQAVHFMTGNVQHLLQTLAAFKNAPMFKHRRGDVLRGIEVVILQAALPGANDRRVASLRMALGDVDDLSGVPTDICTAHFYCSPLCLGGLSVHGENDPRATTQNQSKPSHQHPLALLALQSSSD